jgi:hypothetical protein
VSVDWTNLAQLRNQWWTCERGSEYLGSIKDGELIE